MHAVELHLPALLLLVQSLTPCGNVCPIGFEFVQVDHLRRVGLCPPSLFPLTPRQGVIHQLQVAAQLGYHLLGAGLLPLDFRRNQRGVLQRLLYPLPDDGFHLISIQTP